MICIGWIGLRSEIYDALMKQHDNGEYGEYEFRGDIIYGLDPEEIVLGDNAEYKEAGKDWLSLAKLMEESAYGVRVHVVC